MTMNIPVGLPDVMIPKGSTLLNLLQDEDILANGGFYPGSVNPLWFDSFGFKGRSGRYSKIAAKHFELTYVGKLYQEVEDTFFQILKERGYRIIETFFFLATRRVRDVVLHVGIAFREEDYMFSQIRVPFIALWIPDRPFPPGVAWMTENPPVGPYIVWMTFYVDVDFELIWQRNPILKHLLPYYLKYVKRRRIEELIKKAQQEVKEIDREWRKRTARLMRLK